jgi:hypothetical protein
MRVIFVAAMIVLLSGPAFAQDAAHMQQAGEPDKDKTPAQIRSEKDAKRAYERSLGNIPDKGATDPWGAVRTNDAPKAAAKAAASKSRIAN